MILQAIDDPDLFSPWLRGPPENWIAWRTYLAALFGLEMTEEQEAIYRECTGRSTLPAGPAQESWLVCGRRAGKSFVMALVACWLAIKDYSEYLAPGERATVLLIATDRKQARILFRYISSMLTHIPALNGLVEREWSDGFDLHNQVTIEVATCSFRSVRGYAICAALLDEVAFFRSDDSATPDEEVLAAIRPGLASIPGAMLMCASSPYSRRGAMWNAYQRHYGKDGDPILVWQAPTRRMNPTVSQTIIDEAYERDPDVAASEWGAQFRLDVERIFSTEAVAACVSTGVIERGFVSTARFVGFTDPSGGSSDAMSLAIAHREGDKVIVDAIREVRPPFSPEQVCNDFATLLHGYRVTRVFGDRYGGEWPREAFRNRGIAYEVAEKTRSDLYRDLIPLVNSRRIELLDNPRLISQLVGLERHTARSGKDTIDHMPGGHDDVSNAVAGAADLVATTINATPAGAWNPGPWWAKGRRIFTPLSAR